MILAAGNQVSNSHASLPPSSAQTCCCFIPQPLSLSEVHGAVCWHMSGILPRRTCTADSILAVGAGLLLPAALRGVAEWIDA